MDLYRLRHTIGLCLRFGAVKRGDYLRKYKVFKSVGKRCSFMPRKVPLYPNLIKLGDYVAVASNVAFDTHDGIHYILGENNDIIPKHLRGYKFYENVGCIEIGNHVFISEGSSIGYNVKIGDNVVIAAKSVVTSDIPSNCVVRGNPARVVCSLTQFLTLKAMQKNIPEEFKHIQASKIEPELEDWLWNEFNNDKK